MSLLNDVEAMAAAVPHLRPGERAHRAGGRAGARRCHRRHRPGHRARRSVPDLGRVALPRPRSEGSHVDFGPTTPQQTELLKRLQARWGRVSYERVCAGRSIPDLYDFLKDVGQIAESPAVRAQLASVRDRTPTIMAAGLAPPDPDPLCRAALNLFMSILGAAAGNLVLSVLATGGLLHRRRDSAAHASRRDGAGQLFLSTFQEKGRLSPLLARVPVHIIVEPVALLGAAHHGLDITVSAGRVSV